MAPRNDSMAFRSMASPAPTPTRADFKVLRPMQTRWMDNDQYGHVNNVAYYSYFDSAVNGYLMEATGKDTSKLGAIGIVAETGCRYLKELSFPERLHVGLRRRAGCCRRRSIRARLRGSADAAAGADSSGNSPGPRSSAMSGRRFIRSPNESYSRQTDDPGALPRYLGTA
jgi:hypothetical protein